MMDIKDEYIVFCLRMGFVGGCFLLSECCINCYFNTHRSSLFKSLFHFLIRIHHLEPQGTLYTWPYTQSSTSPPYQPHKKKKPALSSPSKRRASSRNSAVPSDDRFKDRKFPCHFSPAMSSPLHNP